MCDQRMIKDGESPETYIVRRIGEVFDDLAASMALRLTPEGAVHMSVVEDELIALWRLRVGEHDRE